MQRTGSLLWCDVLPQCFTSEAGAACRQPGRKMAEKNGTFLEVKKLGCFWFNQRRGTETQQKVLLQLKKKTFMCEDVTPKRIFKSEL